MPFFNAYSPGVETWIAAYPKGYILTAHNPVDPERITMHRPECPALAEPEDTTTVWVCSERYADLEFWVTDLGFGYPPIHRCSTCMPVNPATDRWWPWTHPRLRHGNEHQLPDPVRAQPLFTQTTSLRKMRVVVDVSTVDTSPYDPKLQYLFELLRSSSIETLFYLRGELPFGLEILRFPYFDHDVVKGWLLNMPDQQDRGKYVYYLDEDGETVHSNGYDDEDSRFGLIVASPKHGGCFGFPDADTYAPDDLHGFLAAEAIDADLYVTTSPTLRDHERFLIDIGLKSTSLVTPDSALPLIGLYLRRNDKYVRAVYDLNSFAFPALLGKGLFYEAAIRELIPAIWNWSRTCARITLHIPGSEIVTFAEATLDRLERSLRARDELLAMTALPVTDETSKEILSLLDQICLWLVGALDAAAIVADQVLVLGTKERQIGWQRSDWLRKVKQSCPDLAALFEADTRGRRLLDVLLELRNTIHSQAVFPAYLSPGKKDNEMFVLVPASRREKILRAIDGEGGRLAWGVYGLNDHRFYLHPTEFVEMLLPSVFALMERVMAITPLERPFHPGPGLMLDERPRAEDNPWGPVTGQRIRWQLGM